VFILFYRTECYACFEDHVFAYLYLRISAVNTSSEVNYRNEEAKRNCQRVNVWEVLNRCIVGSVVLVPQ